MSNDFLDDKDKMKDFDILSKKEFLKSYSYLTEKEYDLTKQRIEQIQIAIKNYDHYIKQKCFNLAETERLKIIYLKGVQ